MWWRYFAFGLPVCALLTLAGCDEDKKPEATATKASAAKPAAPPPSAAAAPEKPKEEKKAKPKKTAEDCGKGPAIAFDDKKVEEEIRKKLEKPTGDVTRADLARLKGLNLSQVPMDQLDPCIFPYAKHLKELFLGPGDIDDLSPLAALTELESLRASITPVKDLKPLAKLTKLERLSLQRTQVKDFSPLKDMKKLKFLYVAGTPGNDISPLNSLKAGGLKIIDQ